jgi:tRNA(Arg) A34 adenosine deaminase TadA
MRIPHPFPGLDPMVPWACRGQNAAVPRLLDPLPLQRRRRLLVAWPWLCVPWVPVPLRAEESPLRAEESPLRAAMRRAEQLREEALRAGDQPYGAVVLCGAAIVGAAPSRVVTGTDPTAHAELEAIRDAARRLRTRDLSACVLVSTSRPCRMCEAAAAWGGIARMVHGEALTDAGAPR